MARVPARRSARDRARLASPGVDGLLAMAVPARNARRAAPYRGRAARPHPEDGRGESPLGATPRPGGARAAWGSRCRRGPSPGTCAGPPRRPFTQVAEFLMGHARGDLGVRLLLCSHDLLPDAVCLLRDASRDPTGAPGSGEPTSHRRMGGPAGRGRVWLGSGPAAVSDPRPGRPVRGRVRPPGATARRHADPDACEGAAGERAGRAVGPIGEAGVS